MNAIKLQRRFRIEYAIIQGLYWALYCVLFGFASVFLLNQGYTNSEIGVILALGFLGSAILQQFVAVFADRTGRISLTTIIIFCIIMLLVSFTGILFIKNRSVFFSFLFIFAAVLLMLVQPLMNSLNFYLEKASVKMNFGVARSMGSLSYAILSFLLGILVERISPKILPVCAVILTVSMMFVMLLIAHDYRLHGTLQEEKEIKSGEKKLDVLPFFLQYRRFFLFLIGVLGLFFGHTLINSYLYQIAVNVGGSSKDLGGIQAMSALLELPAMIFFEQLKKRFGCVKLLKFSAVFFLIKISITLFAGSVPLLYVSTVCQAFAFAIFIPASVHFVNETMRQNDAVKGQAFLTGVITVSNLLASLCGGILIDRYSVFLMLFSGTLVTLGGTVVMILALNLVLIL